MCFNCIAETVDQAACWAALEATAEPIEPTVKAEYITTLAGLHVLAELLRHDRAGAVALLGRIAHGEEPEPAMFLDRYNADSIYWQDINECLQECDEPR